MSLEVLEHSIAGWDDFATEAGFVPDPMILRAGEVFVNGLSGAKALGRSDLDVWAALQENIAGLSDFFDLLVTRHRIPLINYRYTYKLDSLETPLEALLGSKALPISISTGTYYSVKQGAFNSLKRIELSHIQTLGHQLQELDSMCYDWQPTFQDYQGEDCWLSHAQALDDNTLRAARFLLGGFIFSGFAQASQTFHYIQPKRARFFLSITGAPKRSGQLGHEDERSIFEGAIKDLNGTTATVQRLVGLPPVLPYLIGRAVPGATASEILDLALAFPETEDGKRYCEAASAVESDGIQAQAAKDASVVAREEALKMLKPYSELADHDGGFKVEVSASTEGPKISVSKEVHLPGWLRFWWNDHTPFGGVRKTFRRMWLAAESYQRFEKQIRDIWSRS